MTIRRACMSVTLVVALVLVGHGATPADAAPTPRLGCLAGPPQVQLGSPVTIAAFGLDLPGQDGYHIQFFRVLPDGSELLIEDGPTLVPGGMGSLYAASQPTLPPQIPGQYTYRVRGVSATATFGSDCLPITVWHPTRLTASPGVLGLSPLRLRPTATLIDGLTGAPLAGRLVWFTAGGVDLGPVVTDSNGNASLKQTVATLLQIMLSGGYTVNYDGDATFGPSSATAPAIG